MLVRLRKLRDEGNGLRMAVSEQPEPAKGADLSISTDDIRTHRTRVASNRTCGDATIEDQNVFL